MGPRHCSGENRLAAPPATGSVNVFDVRIALSFVALAKRRAQTFGE
jgi:hypothetical protein